MQVLATFRDSVYFSISKMGDLISLAQSTSPGDGGHPSSVLSVSVILHPVRPILTAMVTLWRWEKVLSAFASISTDISQGSEITYT